MAAGTSVLIASALVCTGHAEAHEAPYGTGVYANGAALVVRMSRGLVLRSYERPEYRLLCNEALGVAEYDTPSLLAREDGSWLVGTSTGLKHVSADGCAITLSPALERARITALVRDPHDSAHLYAATDAGFHESRDHGEHFVELDERVFDSIAVPGNPHDLVLAAGRIGAQAYIARWRPGAPIEQEELALEPNEYGVALLGSDAERVFAVARAYLGTPYPDRFLVSEDGGRSWHNRLSGPSIAAFAVDPDSDAWLLGDATGLWRISHDGERTQLRSAAVSCLAGARSQLYICDDAGVSVSADGGEHTRSLLRWNQVVGLVACPSDAPAVEQCEAAWEDWARELPPSPAAPLAAAVTSTLPMRASAAPPSSCAAVGGSHKTGTNHWLWLMLLPILMRIMQAKRTSMTTTMHSVILGGGLVLGLLSGCADDSDRTEDESTRSDSGPRDSGTALEPNRIEDAATSGKADGGSAPRPQAGRPAASGGSGGRASEPAGQDAARPIADSGTAPDTPQPEPEPAAEDDAGPAEPDTLCASCGGCEEVIPVVSAMHTNQVVTYPDPPPTSGPHSPCWGRWGVHDEPLPPERWVHNLEHGAVVFLYNCPDGCDQEVTAIKDLNRHRYRTIITAYANLPTRFGVVSWGHRLLSECLDLDTFNKFYERNFDHAPESNANPPNPTCPP